MNKIVYVLLFALLALPCLAKSPATKNLDDYSVKEILQSENEEDLDKLIKAGFDINSRDEDGNTALFYVLKNNDNLSMALKLIEAGADVNAPSANGMTPLIAAVSIANELKLQKMMLDKAYGDLSEVQAQNVEKYMTYQMNRAIAMLQMLMEQGADINQETPMGTPLMAASTNDWNIEMIELLLDAGVDINQQDRNGRTALFYAYMFDCEDIENLLIKHGADISVKDREGLTYMEAAKE